MQKKHYQINKSNIYIFILRNQSVTFLIKTKQKIQYFSFLFFLIAISLIFLRIFFYHFFLKLELLSFSKTENKWIERKKKQIYETKENKLLRLLFVFSQFIFLFLFSAVANTQLEKQRRSRRKNTKIIIPSLIEFNLPIHS